MSGTKSCKLPRRRLRLSATCARPVVSMFERQQTLEHIPYISARDVEDHLSWSGMLDALAAGHCLAEPRIGDLFLNNQENTFLNRAAWVDGIGLGVKTVTVMGKNSLRGLPSVQGVMVLFNSETGTPSAIIDSDLITRWKTAADSGLGASYLARPDSKSLLIVGAGEAASNLASMYAAIFPSLTSIKIWNRTEAKAQALVQRLNECALPAEVAARLDAAVSQADIVSCATMSHKPVVLGEWVTPGTHVDLVGAFRSDMREADDVLMKKGRIFVDCRETTLDHIGELAIPLNSAVINRTDVLGDLYDLLSRKAGRISDSDITVFKNGGGAHLDLMVAYAILAATRPAGNDRPA